jgi:hypothetical protein
MSRPRSSGTGEGPAPQPDPGRKPQAAAGRAGSETRKAARDQAPVDLQAQAVEYLADNDAWMFGPNAAAVVALLDRLEGIGPDDGASLAEAWQATPKAEREAARKAARKSVEPESDAQRHLQMARESVGTWLAVATNRPEFLKAEPDWPRIGARVAEAALDAITALVLEAELDGRDRGTLTGPWNTTVGRTPAPAAAAEAAAMAGPNEEAGEEHEEGQFGPNSDAIMDLVNRLWLLTPEQVARLVGLWQATPAEDLRIAHEMLHDLVDENAEWRNQVRRAQGSLAPWLNAGPVAETSGFLGQTGQADMRRVAGPVLADAVAALVLGDLLEPEDARTLYGPWFDLVGAPALPLARGDEEEED